MVAVDFAGPVLANTGVTAQPYGCDWTVRLKSRDRRAWNGSTSSAVGDLPRTGWLLLTISLGDESYPMLIPAELSGLPEDHVESSRRTLLEQHQDGLWATLAEELGLRGHSDPPRDERDPLGRSPRRYGHSGAFAAIPPVLERLMLRSTLPSWPRERDRLRHLVQALQTHPFSSELNNVWQLVDTDD